MRRSRSGWTGPPTIRLRSFSPELTSPLRLPEQSPPLRRLGISRSGRGVPSHKPGLGRLPQGTEESEVLFTLIAERYERRSLGITSNLVCS